MEETKSGKYTWIWVVLLFFAILAVQMIFTFPNPSEDVKPYLSVIGTIGVLLLMAFSYVMGIGKSKHESNNFMNSPNWLVASESRSSVKLADIGGLEEAKLLLETLCSFLDRDKEFSRLGARMPKGVLFYGTSGAGKTLLARALSGETENSFFYVSCSEFIEMYAGVGAKRIKELFKEAEQKAPSIIFLDDIDLIGKKTPNNCLGSEQEHTLAQLLAELDGFTPMTEVIVLATTSQPEFLSPSLLRSGRIERQIYLPMPDNFRRLSILKIHMKDKEFDKGISLTDLSRRTLGFTGADLERLLNKAAIQATLKNRNAISNEDVNTAYKKLGLGESLPLSDQQTKNISFYQAGQIVVSENLPNCASIPMSSVSWPPDKMNLNIMIHKVIGKLDSQKQYENALALLLSGRAAEMFKFNEPSRFSKIALEMATNLARQMVCELGMSDVAGLSSYPIQKNSENETNIISSSQKDLIGTALEDLLKSAHQKALIILKTHMDRLEDVAQSLWTEPSGVVQAQDYRLEFPDFPQNQIEST